MAIKVTDVNRFGKYELSGMSTDVSNLPTTFPCNIDSTEINELETGSYFVAVDTQDVKFYSKDTNTWY